MISERPVTRPFRFPVTIVYLFWVEFEEDIMYNLDTV
jgi:hypothetical protein